MKILIFSSGHRALAARIFSKEGESIKKRFPDLTITGLHPHAIDRIHEIDVIGIPPRKSRFNRFAVWRKLYHIALDTSPDIIHCHEPDSLALAALVKKKLRKLKIIYDCHEFHPESLTENLPSPFARFFTPVVRFLEGKFAKRADAVITVNEFLAQRFMQLGLNTIVLPNYPLNTFIPAVYPERTVPGRGNLRLVYAGGLSKERGLFFMIHLVEQLIENGIRADLVLMGKFVNDNIKQQYDELVRKKTLSDHIHYLGYLSHEEVMAKLMDAHFGICLLYGKKRYDWGEPIKYFEYSALGLPVIICDLPAKRRLIEKVDNGILVDMKADTVAIAVSEIEKVIHDPNRYRNMSLNGWKAAIDEYNWSSIENRLLDLYDQLT